MPLNNPSAQVTESGIVLADNTTGNVSTGAHGFQPKLTGNVLDVTTWGDGSQHPVNDPVHGYYREEDFLSSGLSLVATPFEVVVNGTASTATSMGVGTGDINHPGQIALNSGTANPSGIGVYAYRYGMLLGGGEMCESIFEILSTATMTNLSIYAGFMQTITGAAPTVGAWFTISGGTTYATVTPNCGNASGTVAGSTFGNGTSTGLAKSAWYHSFVFVDSTAANVYFYLAPCAGITYAMSGTVPNFLAPTNSVYAWPAVTSKIPTAASYEVGPAFVMSSTLTSNVQQVALDKIAVGVNRTLTR